MGYGHVLKTVICGLVWSVLFHAVYGAKTNLCYGGLKQILLDAAIFATVYGLLQLAVDYLRRPI
jgi:hypothetical protein